MDTNSYTVIHIAREDNWENVSPEKSVMNLDRQLSASMHNLADMTPT